MCVWLTTEKFKIDSSLAKLGMNGFCFTVESLLTMEVKKDEQRRFLEINNHACIAAQSLFLRIFLEKRFLRLVKATSGRVLRFVMLKATRARSVLTIFLGFVALLVIT